MVVWRTHGPVPPEDVRERLLAALRRVADGLFGPDGYRVDEQMRNIPDHYHAHARRRLTPSTGPATVPVRAGKGP